MFDYIVDPSQKIEKIIAGEQTNINYFTKKLTFYNPAAKEPFRKFWYLIPSAVVTKNQDAYVAALSVQNKEIIASIDSLDDKLNELYKLPQTRSVKIENAFFPCLPLQVTQDTIFFDKNGNVKQDILINTCIMLIVEYTSILASSSNIVRKWTLIQAKELPSLDTSVDLFDKFNNINKMPLLPPPPPAALLPPPPMQLPLPPLSAPKQPATEEQVVKYIPTPNELLNMRGRLKKTIDPDTKNEINEVMNKCISDYDHSVAVLEMDEKIFFKMANSISNVIQ